MAERVWRVRKNHSWMDARIQETANPASQCTVELTCFCDGEPIYARRWPTRDLALTDADARLKELLCVGWTTHW
ncbi:MAG: hypothetical protein HY048_18415 [Acidobacteria bacterium]|nr:hypothetical protein [Acidobacteriota bacterium]